MSQTNTPLFSFGATGTLADTISYRPKATSTVAQKKPSPKNANTLSQRYHRWDYADAAYLWHALTPSEKLIYRKTGTLHKMPAFAFWLRGQLNTLPNLAARYHLDEHTGTIASDSSKNENHATIFGASHIPGKIDYALSFDGIDDYIYIPHDPSLNALSAFSIELWYYRKTYTPWAGIINKGNDYNANYALESGALTDKIRIAIGNGSTYDSTSEITISSNRWYHLVATGSSVPSGTTLTLYIDGLVATTITLPISLTPCTQNLVIGKRPSATQQALIDEAKIYTRALSLDEIQTHFLRRYP